MKSQAVVHGTFVIERGYDAAPARVFAAWAEPALKARWFIGPDGWMQVKRELDFRVGGSELLHGRFAGGPETIFTARYHDIVRDERIVFVYDMHLNREPHSVSIATVEIEPDGAGARLRFTEQVAFLDGTDSCAPRERGTAAHLERLDAVLRQ